MTAIELIDDILARPQAGMPARERVITPDQLSWLRVLIGRDREAAALRSDGPFAQVWTSAERTFRIIESPRGRGHKLTEIVQQDGGSAGLLF